MGWDFFFLFIEYKWISLSCYRYLNNRVREQEEWESLLGYKWIMSEWEILISPSFPRKEKSVVISFLLWEPGNWNFLFLLQSNYLVFPQVMVRNVLHINSIQSYKFLKSEARSLLLSFYSIKSNCCERNTYMFQTVKMILCQLNYLWGN